MCPLCISTALLLAYGATSTGGVAAIAIKTFSVKNTADNHPDSTRPGRIDMASGLQQVIGWLHDRTPGAHPLRS